MNEKKIERDNRHILGFDIETSQVKGEYFLSEDDLINIENECIKKYSYLSNRSLERKIEEECIKFKDKMNEPIQVHFLNNTLEMDMETGEIVKKSSNKGDGVFFRTIPEWVDYINSISVDKERIVYCHNLHYELFTIMREMGASMLTTGKPNEYGVDNIDGIMRRSTDILYARLDCCPNIIFRDSNGLFDTTVKSMGEFLNKREGSEDNSKIDYDYMKVRLPDDELEQIDYDYNERDNYIVLKRLYYFLKDNEIEMSDIPLTSTSHTRNRRREFALDNYPRGMFKGANARKLNSKMDYEFYNFTRKTYQGGLTASNWTTLGKAVNDVISIDIKSSYPYQMISRYFPYFSKKGTVHLVGREANKFYNDNLHGISFDALLFRKSKSRNSTDVRGYYGMFTFRNLRLRNEDFLLDISLEKVLEGDSGFYGTVINGKVKDGNQVTLRLNNVDLQKIIMLYECDEMIASELWYTKERSYLPNIETSFILENFGIKENTDKKLNPVEYDKAKVTVNAQYGGKVQDIVQSMIFMDKGEIVEVDFDKVGSLSKGIYKDIKLSKEEIYNNKVNSDRKTSIDKVKKYDVYSDGVYITSYARYMLQEMMVRITELGGIVNYADTDSLKFSIKNAQSVGSTESIKNIINFIKDRNKSIIKDNTSHERFQQYYAEFVKNDKSKSEQEKEAYFNKITRLGIWEFESLDSEGEIKPYRYFKSFGAKKYVYIDDEGVRTTIAGCSKKILPKAIERYARKQHITFVEACDFLFSEGVRYDESVSGRTTVVKERRSREECERITYKGKKLNSYGGIVISPATYTLNPSENDSTVLENVERSDEWKISLNKDGDITYNKGA